MDYGTNINLHLLLHLHWPLYISAILDNHRLYHIPRTSNKKLRERTRGTSARKNCEGLTNTHKISPLLQYGFSEKLRWMNHLRTSQISDVIEIWTFLVEALWSSRTQKSIETNIFLTVSYHCFGVVPVSMLSHKNSSQCNAIKLFQISGP